MKNIINIIATFAIVALGMVSCTKESLENVQADINTQIIVGESQNNTSSSLSTRSTTSTIYKLRVTFNHIRCNSVNDGWLGSKDGEEIYGNLGFRLQGLNNYAESPYLWNRLRTQAQGIKAGYNLYVNQSHTFLVYAHALEYAGLYWTGNVREKDENLADDDTIGNPNLDPGGRIGWNGFPVNDLQLNRPVQRTYNFGRNGSYFTAFVTLTLLPN